MEKAMFAQTNRIFGTLRKTKIILAAAVAAVGLGTATHAYGAISDVLSIQTQLTTGSPTSVSNLSGVGTDSGYDSTDNYTIDYANDDLAVTQITTATGTFSAGPLGTVVVNRSSGGNNNDMIFDQGAVAPEDSVLPLMGTQQTSTQGALSGNNLLIGADNVLNNTGNPNGNNTNIQRLDFIFNGGVTASASSVFALFDRGLNGAHDGFKIAAITSVNGSGVPTGYGPLIDVGTGTWGNTNVISPELYSVTRKSDSSPTNAFHPADQADQPIGGVVIPTDALASDGATIFGYSLFATDVTASGSALASIANLPTTTTETNGGLDLVGTAAVLYTSTSVPEPTTAVLGIVGVAGLLGRRNRRRA
jgi:MYXO-CTERM domain-containing protein